MKPSRLATFDGYARLAKAALLVALYDAANAADVGRAAEARFWLAFGDGAQIAELLDRAGDVRAYLDGLPPLPKQDGECEIVSLARLMRFEEDEM